MKRNGGKFKIYDLGFTIYDFKWRMDGGEGMIYKINQDKWKMYVVKWMKKERKREVEIFVCVFDAHTIVGICLIMNI